MEICKFYLILSLWKRNFIFTEVLHAEKHTKNKASVFALIFHATHKALAHVTGNYHHLIFIGELTLMLDLFSFLAYKAPLKSTVHS